MGVSNMVETADRSQQGVPGGCRRFRIGGFPVVV